MIIVIVILILAMIVQVIRAMILAVIVIIVLALIAMTQVVAVVMTQVAVAGIRVAAAGEIRMKNKPNKLKKIYNAIYHDDTKMLNWFAMVYFIKNEKFIEAAACREKVKSWNKNGPI